MKPPTVGKFDFLKMANVMKILGATITIEDIANKIDHVVKFTDELNQVSFLMKE